MKKFLIIIVTVALFSCNQVVKTSEISTMINTIEIKTPKEAVNALVEGNMRFVNDSTVNMTEGVDYAKSLATSQYPFACVVGCSDSRVPLELLFDQGFGEIFVVRTAGNTVLDDFTAGSVEYAVNHLGVKAIVVLGHTSCGAIAAIVDIEDGDGIQTKSPLTEMLQDIKEELHLTKETSIEDAIIQNVQVQINNVMELDGVAEMVDAGELIVVPAIYDLSTGKVTFI